MGYENMMDFPNNEPLPKKPFYLEIYDWTTGFIRDQRRKIAVAGLVLIGALIQKAWPENPFVEPIVQFLRVMALLLGAS